MLSILLDILVIFLLLLIAGGIIFYLYRQKKRGVRCVGCPYAHECAKKSETSPGSCSCSRHKNT